jgi:NAD-dependent SIR2 family protein deacetylase
MVLCEKFGVTVLYNIASVGCENTYRCLRQISHSSFERNGNLLCGIYCERTDLSSHRPNNRSTLMQILEKKKILFHVIQQQLLY